MANATYPSLSASGWVTAMGEKADNLFADFMVAESLQSHTCQGSVTSLPDIVQKYRHDPLRLAEEVRTALEVYYGRYYDSAEFQVTLKNANTTGTTYGFEIYGKLVSEGKEYSLGKLLETDGHKVRQVFDKNNFG